MSGSGRDSTAPPVERSCPRPLAPRLPDTLQNPEPPACAQPVERQRVRRACLECRAKKVKCNGADPCARCTSLQIKCEYGDQGFRSNIDPSQVDKLEARMAAIEQMFHSVLEKIDAIQGPNAAAPVHTESAVAVDHYRDFQHEPSAHDAVYNTVYDSHDTQNAHDTGPSAEAATSKMQQLLDAAAEADAVTVVGAVASPGPVIVDDDPPPYQSRCSGSPPAEDATVRADGQHAPPPADADDPHADDTNDAHSGDPSDHNDEQLRVYADGFGELDVDFNGQLRYVGLGSTASVVDNCLGLRRHIDKGLERKGFEPDGAFLASPEATRLDHHDHDEEVAPSPADARDHSQTPCQDSNDVRHHQSRPLHHHHHQQGPGPVDLPPAALVDVLIDIYAHQLAFLFPITTAQYVRHIHQTLRQQQAARQGVLDSGCAAVFFALLAVTSPLLPQPGDVDAAAAPYRAALQDLDPKWRSPQLGALFYNEAMHCVNMPLPFRKSSSHHHHHHHHSHSRIAAQNIVVALGLLSMYLAETGSQAEAWIAVGRAIRNAQDLGLHRSPERLRLPKEERNQRRYIWWCLYVLERQLCTALGRPLSIDDQDCDTEVPTAALGCEVASPDKERSSSSSSSSRSSRSINVGFFACMIHLHRIIGEILKMVNSVRSADAWHSLLAEDRDTNKDAGSSTNKTKLHELSMQVRAANEKLQSWARDAVPAAIKMAKPGAASGSGPLLAQKHVALSSFFSAVMLLHRVFMSNPHRPSPLAGSQAQRKSAKAATDCIRETAEFVQSVPRSHYLVFHGQYVFVSAVVLLQCIRASADDARFVYAALRDVERAMDVLAQLQSFWRGANKCRATIEEYLDFTFFVIQGDRKGQCQFECGDHQQQQQHGSSSSSAEKKKKKHTHAHGHDEIPRKRPAPSCSTRDAKRPRQTARVGSTMDTGTPDRRPQRHVERRKMAGRPRGDLGTTSDAAAPHAVATRPRPQGSADDGREDQQVHCTMSPSSLGAVSVLSATEQPSFGSFDPVRLSPVSPTTTTATATHAASSYDEQMFQPVQQPLVLGHQHPHPHSHRSHHYQQGVESATDPSLGTPAFSEPRADDAEQLDLTIGNFLGAINPSFHLHDSFFNGLAGLDFAMAEPPFPPPAAGHGSGCMQNSFF